MNRVEWLRAQIETRKAKAEAADRGPWRIDPRHRNVVMGTDLIDSVGVAGRREDMSPIFTGQTSNRGQQSYKDAEHIAANDPRDTIARCDSELAILDEHKPGGHYAYRDDGTRSCGTCGDYTVKWPCDTIRLLAQGYRYRDGYADHWPT